jgi:hypothetical protein
MSEMGQTEKNSVRAHVFRFALELGHCPTQSACLKRANAGSDASSFDHLVGAAEIGRRQSRCCMRACISCKALGVALVSPAAARY